MADEPDLAKEVREASEAVAKAARTRTADDAAKAADESMDVVRIGLARGWTWQAWLSAVVAVGLLACGAFYVGSRTETPIAERKVEPVKGKVGDEADVVKVITDGFAKLDTSLTTGFAALGKKIDDKPVPPVDPDKPKPPSGLIPAKLSIAVGPAAIKVISSNASAQWYWESGLSVDVHAGYVYVSAVKDGEYLLVAYTSDGKKINDFAACRVTAGTAPQPPPGPTPEPKPPVPPTPQDWPTTAPGLRVLIVFEEMERHKLSAGQRPIIDGAPIRDWLDAKCVQDGPVKAWRIFDKDQGVHGAEKHWKDMMGRNRASVPWVVICNYPKAYYEGPLPASVDEFKTQVQKVE